MMNRTLKILALTLISTSAFSHSSEERLEKWSVPFSSEKEIDDISKKFEIVGRDGNSLEIIVNSKDTEGLKKIAPNAKVSVLDIGAKLENDLKSVHEKSGKVYKNYHEVMDFVKSYASKNSDVVKLIKYGESRERRPLYALRVSADSSPKKNILYSAAIHGDELVTVESLTRAMDSIMDRYRSGDQSAVKLLEENTVYFIPVVSPDSFEHMDRYVDFRFDPNRAFPWKHGEANPHLKSVKNLVKFYADHRIDASIDFHSAGEIIMYPYSYTRNDHPEKSRYQRVAEALKPNNNYRTGQVSQLLYIARGSSIDHFYDKHGAVSFAVELGKEKVPGLSEVKRIAQDVEGFLLNFPTELKKVGL